jgi:predicted TIM-barrel fold metal-dependent hydrolase
MSSHSGRLPGAVVDTHVHVLPVRLNQSIRAFFTRLGTSEFAYPVDPAEVCGRLAAEGVSRAWTLPYVRRPGTAAGLNRAVAAIVAAQSDAAGPVGLIGGCTVHPADDDPRSIVDSAVRELGARVLKLHCSVGDFTPDDRRLDHVWEYVSEIRLPVVIHAGHAPTGHTAAEELAPVATVAERFPDARLIVAHCGHPALTETLDLIENHRGVHADLTPVVSEPIRLPRQRAAAVATKLLFGSDVPNTRVTVTQSLEALEGLGLSGGDISAITGGNAQRLQSEILATP